MRAKLLFGASLLTAAIAMPAFAEDAPADPFGAAVSTEALGHLRGGTETQQNNITGQWSSASGPISVSNDAAKINGLITGSMLSNTSGITSLMQNTGDNVNLNNATSVNVYLH